VAWLSARHNQGKTKIDAVKRILAPAGSKADTSLQSGNARCATSKASHENSAELVEGGKRNARGRESDGGRRYEDRREKNFADNYESGFKGVAGNQKSVIHPRLIGSRHSGIYWLGIFFANVAGNAVETALDRRQVELEHCVECTRVFCQSSWWRVGYLWSDFVV